MLIKFNEIISEPIISDDNLDLAVKIIKNYSQLNIINNEYKFTKNKSTYNNEKIILTGCYKIN